MKRKPYTVQEKEELLKSEAIEKVNDYQVTYSTKFKVFATGEYMTLKDNNVIQSMSRKGNCIDNAPMESFFGHLKDELDYKNCKTFEELVEKIDEYIYYYNNERYQWNKLKMVPVQYRNHLLMAS